MEVILFFSFQILVHCRLTLLAAILTGENRLRIKDEDWRRAADRHLNPESIASVSLNNYGIV